MIEFARQARGERERLAHRSSAPEFAAAADDTQLDVLEERGDARVGGGGREVARVSHTSSFTLAAVDDRDDADARHE